jgi:pimeloyl-ACP methyl ester carboxylesterase
VKERDPVLLLHAQPGGAADWDPVVAAIGGRVPTLAIDRPGYDGHSQPGGIAHSAQAAIARLDAHGIERTVIVGLSYGGGVAAWIAALHPERVEALVLISPAANLASLAPFDRVLAAPVIGPAITASILGGAGSLSLVAPIRRRVSAAWGIPEPYVRRKGASLLTLATLRTFVVEQRALFDDLPLLDAVVSRITAPTTIMIGSRDTIVPPAANRRLARHIAGARLFELDGARHALAFTHPTRVAELIVEASAGAAERRSGAPGHERQEHPV